MLNSDLRLLLLYLRICTRVHSFSFDEPRPLNRPPSLATGGDELLSRRNTDARTSIPIFKFLHEFLRQLLYSSFDSRGWRSQGLFWLVEQRGLRLCSLLFQVVWVRHPILIFVSYLGKLWLFDLLRNLGTYTFGCGLASLWRVIKCLLFVSEGLSLFIWEEVLVVIFNLIINNLVRKCSKIWSGDNCRFLGSLHLCSLDFICDGSGLLFYLNKCHFSRCLLLLTISRWLFLARGLQLRCSLLFR